MKYMKIHAIAWTISMFISVCLVRPLFAMRRNYPKAKIFIGTVEGFPSLNDVVSSVKHMGIKKVLLKPFMIVAGDHAHNDMAGNDEDSWKNTFKRAGIRVKCILKGLGENPRWDEIYVQHIRDVAMDNGIKL